VKITAFAAENYRTLENVLLRFPSSYAALCGPNDCGKTNVVRAIRALTKDEQPFRFITGPDNEDFAIKTDYPKWKDVPAVDRRITLTLTLEVEQDRDAGFYQFLKKQLSIERTPPLFSIVVSVTQGPDRSEQRVRVECDGEVHTGIEAQEVLKRFQTSRFILFHNSTQLDPRFPFTVLSSSGVIRAHSPEHEALVGSLKMTVNRGLSKISKTHQKELEGLLGRLETKYKVGLSIPAFDFSSVPFNVTLGQKKFHVPLDDWGSGTRNRTLILMALFRAKQLSESEVSASKITPVLVVEEPESFLHPAAQAEFGRVLHDLSEEFRVQVIVTTHSPYLLSIDNPASNILLRRHIRYKQLQETECVETVGDNWMQPFSLALGLESDEFKPWKSLLLATASAVLLVEGDTDKAYFELIRNADHGMNRLKFDGEILSYEGTGALKNTVLLRFIKNRFQRMFVTYDLDAEESLGKSLESLGLERKKHFAPVGHNSAGKRNIEGLLPESITKSVYAANANLVQAVTSGTKSERESAKNSLKKLLLDEFRQKATPGDEFFGGFYPLVKVINNALG
jgi:putative ATP-dependent endonuclease of OLD family